MSQPTNAELAKLSARLDKFVSALRNDEGVEEGDFDLLEQVGAVLYAASLDRQHGALAYAGLWQMEEMVGRLIVADGTGGEDDDGNGGKPGVMHLTFEVPHEAVVHPITMSAIYHIRAALRTTIVIDHPLEDA